MISISNQEQINDNEGTLMSEITTLIE